MAQSECCGAKNLRYNCDPDGRVVTVILECSDLKAVIFGVYFPCDDLSRLYIHSLTQLLSYIESVMSNFVGFECILVGDFYFECSSSSAGFTEFSKFMNEYHLVCCDSLDSSKCGFTYYHEGLYQRSLIDHTFVSCALRSRIQEYRIIGTMLVDYGHSTGFGVCLCSLRLAANH